jgi:hypothetical protein
VAAAGDLTGSWVIVVDAIILGWLLSGQVRRRFARTNAAVGRTPAAPGI